MNNIQHLLNNFDQINNFFKSQIRKDLIALKDNVNEELIRVTKQFENFNEDDYSNEKKLTFIFKNDLEYINNGLIYLENESCGGWFSWFDKDKDKEQERNDKLKKKTNNFLS